MASQTAEASGISDHVRSLADAMRARADDVRAEGYDLTRRAHAVPWAGVAASAMRRVVEEHVARLRGCATAHEEAAGALDHHAAELDRTLGDLDAVERRVAGVAGVGVAQVSRLARAVGDVADDVRGLVW